MPWSRRGPLAIIQACCRSSEVLPQTASGAVSLDAQSTTSRILTRLSSVEAVCRRDQWKWLLLYSAAMSPAAFNKVPIAATATAAPAKCRAH